VKGYGMGDLYQVVGQGVERRCEKAGNRTNQNKMLS
jgi:hypothetical protein